MGALPSINMQATGDNIVRMRRRMGMTVQDLQNVFDFSTPQAIYKWQRGTAMPTLDKLNFIADDGAYLDPENFDLLKQYVVTRQDVKPNTEIRLTFMKDSKGNEYSNLVQSQSYESITLYVHKLKNK